MTNELMEKIASQDPEMYKFFVDVAPAIQSSPFQEEITTELDGIMKRANALASMGSRMGGALGAAGKSVALSAGTGIAMSLAGDMYDALKRGLTKSRYYRNMLDDNPELKNLPTKDVQRAFNALHQFNPEFASNPTVAGSFVKRQATLADFDPTMLGNIISSRKALSETKKIPGGPKVEMGNRGGNNEGEQLRNLEALMAGGGVGQVARARAKRLSPNT